VDTETVRREGERVADLWYVLGSRDRQADKLTERRIWLRGLRSGRTAMLLAFGAMQTAPALALPVGTAYEAEMAFHREALPLRAQMEGGQQAEQGSATPPEGGSLAEAADAFGAALAADPWQEGWPVLVRDAVPALAGGRGVLRDAEGRVVPLLCEDPALWRLMAVSGGHPVTVFGEYTDAGLEPLTVWAEGSAVAL
jgi:hypothetical protein